MTSLSLNELSDTVIDKFVAKLKEDIKQRPPQPARSPPRLSADQNNQKSLDLIPKISAADLPWALETVFYQ